MATTSRIGSPKGNIKHGVCENHQYYNPDTGETGDCPKCASGEVQAVNVQKLSDFKCSVCGEKLTLVKQGTNKKTIGIIAVAVVALGGIGYSVCNWIGNHGSGATDGIDTTKIDTPQTTDSGVVVETPVDSPKITVEEPAGGKSGKYTSEPASASQSVLGGAATLINEGTYKTLKFKRAYNLDLGKSDGSTLHINAGDEIYNAHISHGVLKGGQYKDSNGNEESISGINVKL